MKHISNILNWIKTNWFLLLLAAWFAGYTWASAKKIENVTTDMAKEMRMDQSFDKYDKGAAVYFPGAACTIRAAPDVDKQLFMDLAMACARKHELYLLNGSK